ncbi:ATP-binding protein [Fictibacillus terranigra]|uniref:histidine kinase n=1 Tax=Fictibacillus terranigra TaxID=3058424 RepID=A0ABT8E0R7_9BACL|nr:ATP-binding protein [Fictibacillus sp. CENA-BCM004]MDN4071510.1 ATP-binding protein [Fictibacillus sp. CENA-BCM004]
MNGFTDDKLILIKKRNKLLYKLLWGFFVIDVLFDYIFDRDIVSFMLPVGFGIGGLITFFAVWNRTPVFSMYLTATGIFSFLFCLISVQPVLVNYLYIWFCLLLSTIYSQYKVIIYSGALAVAMSTYFFFTDRELFSSVEDFDLVFILLLLVFLTVFFVLSTQFTENLRMRAENRERHTASQLVESKEYFHSVFSQTADAILVQNLKGDVLAVNRAFIELYGWKEEEVLRKPFQHIPSTQMYMIGEVFQKMIKGEAVSGYEMVNQKKTEELFPVSVTFSPIRNPDGTIKAIAGIYRDITETKRTEELIIQSEKLSVIGQLAAGVAHEIKNPLAILSGFVQFMQEEHISDEYTTIMLTEINRMNRILEEYMQLARVKQFTYEEVDLSGLVKETLLLMEAFASLSNISIKNGIQDDCRIRGDSNSLKQVFINLIKNAVEASPKGSQVEVSVKRISEGYAIIEVKDEGHGLDKDQLKKLGEPFFTTKDKGTGLGLMVSFKIIDQHNGEVTVTSEPNKGTVFSVKLPKLPKKSS